jgi:hypothetical protein
MQVRITRFKMRPESVAEARALMEDLREEILGQPGMRHCQIAMNSDGSGYVVAQIDEDGISPEGVDRVRAVWHKFHDYVETPPSPEIYEVVADWPG